MATVVRAEISESNKYWISKHRHYELKHFCLQYPEWKKEYLTLGVPSASSAMLEVISSTNTPSDLTARYAIRRVYYAERIDLIEKIAKEAGIDYEKM